MKKLHIFFAALLLAVFAAVFLPPRAEAAVGYTLEDGVLTVTGDGPMSDYATAADAPWHARRAEITRIVVKSGITAIGSNSFTWCENVTVVSLPDGLLSIGKNSFWGCAALEEISLPDTLEHMGTCAFFKSGLRTVSIPAGVTVLEQGIFGQCQQLKAVTLPDTLEAIHKDAFSRCYALQQLALPASLETVGEHAFFACVQLAELTFPENLNRIDSAAFYGCGNLTVLRFAGPAPTLAEDAFLGLAAVVYYPTHEESWQAVSGNPYGGEITWASACDHSFTSVFTPPTCEEKGYSTFTCALCGYSYQDLFVDALGHSFTNYISDGNATVDADGTKTAHCDRGCGATDTIADEGSRLYGGITSDVYTIDEETLHAVPVGTTAADFRENIHQKSIRILKNGQQISDSTSIATGMVVQLLTEDRVVGAWVIIVTGDVNGDGSLSVTDMLSVKAHLLKKTLLDGIFAQAADTSGDHAISITDFIQIKAHILGKSQVIPR